MNNDTLNRRFLLMGGVAAGVCAAAPAWAHQQTPFVMPDAFRPAVVHLDADLPPGELHVLPNQFRLYWTLTNREAIRFTIGVGRPGLYHAGHFTVGAKREWPSWKPTAEMIQRNPDAYGKYADGMPGGINNPLGARALYLYDEAGDDTMLRIHGTNDPRTIGSAVSNGCARLTNDDIVLLYGGVEIGSPVFLHPQGALEADASMGPPVYNAFDTAAWIPREVVIGRSPGSASGSWPRGR